MPEHWVDVLTEIIECDDHLLDFEENDYLTENGTPKDFAMEGAPIKKCWNAHDECSRILRSHERISRRNSYIAKIPT